MKKRVKVLFIVLAVVVFGIIGVIGYLMYKVNGLGDMTFDEMIEYTTKDNNEAVIAVGIINGDDVDIKFYGEDGEQLPYDIYEYEIGSITKTFTTALLCKHICLGEMSLDDSIDKYLDLPQNNYFPTLKDLVTHTSGYKNQYYDKQMVSNKLGGESNYFYSIDKENVINKASEVDLKNKEYPFRYSNFGMSLVGQVTAENIGSDYASAMTRFIEDDLGLENTRISNGTGNMDNYWSWQNDDGYLPAGAIISTIDDMVQYAVLNINEEYDYLAMAHQEIKEVDAGNKQYESMGIYMNAMGAGWVIDKNNNIIWHNGGTSDFNAYLGFDMDKQIGVVILSNLPPSYRIPTTVMGSKLIRDLQDEQN